jgi:transcriptional regulator with XRE-family HTH domain
VSRTCYVKGALHDRAGEDTYSHAMAKAQDSPGQRLATSLRAARAELGWSQERLADEADVSRQTVIRYESGAASNPEAANLRKICAAAGIDIRELLVDLGYLTRDEVQLPPKEPALPAFVRNILAVLKMDRLDDRQKANFERHIKAAMELWADTLGVDLPVIKEPSAAERAGRKPAKR